MESILKNECDDLYMLPVYLLKYGMELKDSQLKDIQIYDAFEFYIFPSDLSQDELIDPKSINQYTLDRHIVLYEKQLFEVFKSKDAGKARSQILNVMKAFLAIHCI